MKHSFLKTILFVVYSFLFGAESFAQSLNPFFVEIDTNKYYRIVNAEYSKGAIGIGAMHDSNILVKYIDDEQKLADDCYWHIEREKEVIRFRNKATSEYLSFSPEKDYTTFINLKLQSAPTTKSEWGIGVHDGYLYFYHQADVKYYIGVDKSMGMVKSSTGVPEHASKYFYLVDENGESLKIPAVTPFQSSKAARHSLCTPCLPNISMVGTMLPRQLSTLLTTQNIKW